MKKFLTCLLLVVSPLAGLASPGSVEQDLGQGLAYCRVHTLPADLQAAPGPNAALVLDLRFTREDSGAASALGALLKARGKSGLPVFVLVNDETCPAALAYLSAHEPGPGFVTLSPRSSRLEADITLRASDAEDRAAYEAAEHGTPLATLLTDPTPKARHDEASIAQDRTESALDVDASDPAEIAKETAPAPAAPRPVIDHVLLRAVHLHRALLALRHL